MVGGSEQHFSEQRRIFGEFIRSQRKLAQLSLRDLAARADISNPYLSQIERGLHEPSLRILRALANGLNVSVNSLLSRLGEEHSPMGAAISVEDAIRADDKLDTYRKEILIKTYRRLLAGSDAIGDLGNMVQDQSDRQ